MGVVVRLSSGRSYGTVGKAYPGFSNSILEGFTAEHRCLTILAQGAARRKASFWVHQDTEEER